MTDFYVKVNDVDVTSDIAVIAFCVVLALIFIIGIVQRVRKNGVQAVVEDETVLKIKKILTNELGNILNGMGLTADYESFKNQILLEALKKVREYTDKKGGVIDAVADSISDDAILEIINEALQLSDLEQQVKEAYDNLIYSRIDEINKDGDEAAAEVDEEGFSTETYDDEESVDVLAEPEKIEVDKE
jgi:hypothetical protein